MGGYIYHSNGEPLANERGEIYLAQAVENTGEEMIEITDRETLAGAILANGDASELFYYCAHLMEEYERTRNESTVGAMAGIIIAIHQILCGTTDYDEDFSIWIHELMRICIDLHRRVT